MKAELKSIGCTLKIILDSGALFLDLSNKDAAKELLKQSDENSFDAAVYFKENTLFVLTRTGTDDPFQLSPFKDRLDRCVIFLDDIHTRGTDLKLPRGSHACVTFSANMKKDKLVQSCMRMRQLGRGHTVSFWCPKQVYEHLQQTNNVNENQQKPKALDVMKW